MVLRVLVALALLLLAGPYQAAGQITVTAPPSLSADAERIRRLDLRAIDAALQRAGLARPEGIEITLIPERDPRAAGVPSWIVGFAAGQHDIVIFPERVVSYPYDSLESVVEHELTHLALNARAGDAVVPRWFHEGVAVSVDTGWDLESRVRLVTALLTQPDIGTLSRLFASADESATRQAYLLAALLVDDLRNRHGASLPGDIAARMAEGVPFVSAFEARTGETPDAAAARAWDAYRRWTAWVPSLTSASAVWGLILVIAFAAYAARRRQRARRRRQWDEEEREDAGRLTPWDLDRP